MPTNSGYEDREGLLVLLSEPDVLAFIGFCLLAGSWLLPAMVDEFEDWVTLAGTVAGTACLLMAGARFVAERSADAQASPPNFATRPPGERTVFHGEVDNVIDLSTQWPVRGGDARHASRAALTVDRSVGVEVQDIEATVVHRRWTLELLREIEWKRFENLCAGYFEASGYRTELQQSGFDGGIDIRVFRQPDTSPWMVVQCKAWQDKVGVKEVRELLGVATASKVPYAVFMTTSGFQRNAREFAATAGNIELVDGTLLLERLLNLDRATQTKLLLQATEGDYRTPTCAGCGGKMKHHADKPSYWQCPRAGCRKRRVPRIYERNAP